MIAALIFRLTRSTRKIVAGASTNSTPRQLKQQWHYTAAIISCLSLLIIAESRALQAHKEKF